MKVIIFFSRVYICCPGFSFLTHLNEKKKKKAKENLTSMTFGDLPLFLSKDEKIPLLLLSLLKYRHFHKIKTEWILLSQKACLYSVITWKWLAPEVGTNWLLFRRWWWFSCSVMSYSCDPMDCSLPGSSVHGISQARILEWVAISLSRGSPQPRNQTWVSCIAGGFFTNWATRKSWFRRLNLNRLLASSTQNSHWYCRNSVGTC